MSTGARSESQFSWAPRLAAWAFDAFMGGDNAIFYQDFAQDISAHITEGYLLDLCAGPGLLLAELEVALPGVDLAGLDLSPAMVTRAQRRLSPDTTMACAPAAAMPYEDASLDTIVCCASFYQWDEPVAGLNEIHRVLRPGGLALLYETHSDCDLDKVRALLKRNAAGSLSIRKRLLPFLLLRHFRMTYRRTELFEIFEQSRFAGRHSSEPCPIAGLPGWLRITMTRA